MKAKQFATLLELLAEIKFPERYYQFYEIGRDRSQMKNLQHEDIVKALSKTPLSFKHVKKDNFFVHKEQQQDLKFTFKVSFRYSEVEGIFHFEKDSGPVGGPFPLLAWEASKRINPDFTYSPRAPRPLFSTLEELQETVDLAVSLYNDMKKAVLAHDWKSEAGHSG